MFAHPHHSGLDTPPPPSQFRRPWSPDPYTPSSSLPRSVHNIDDYFGPFDNHNNQNNRREPSDPSVEALDLADYAHRLTVRPYATRGPGATGSPYHLSQDLLPASPYDDIYQHRASPPPGRPLASLRSTRTPSLLSPSQQTDSSAASHGGGAPRTPTRRPFSLPAPAVSRSSGAGGIEVYPLGAYDDPTSHYARGYRTARPDAYEEEVDLASFGAFSGRRYDQAPSTYPSASTRRRSGAPFPTPPSHTHQPSKPAFFDPGHIPSSSPFAAYGPDPPFAPSYPQHAHSAYSDSSPMLLPWGANTPDAHDAHGPPPPLDDVVRAERMRILERKFGSPSAVDLAEKAGAHASSAENDGGNPPVPIGSVDARGRLVTEGRRKRAFTRGMQFCLCALVAGSSLYSALGIKFKKGEARPPPSGTPQTYVMYVLSVLSALVCAWMFIVRPCCGHGRRKPSAVGRGIGGLAVLPVQHLPGGGGADKNGKKKKKGKKGAEAQGDVQVNLIVDPALLRGHDGRDASSSSSSESESEFGWDGSQWRTSSGSTPSRPSHKHHHHGRRKKRRGPKRRSVFEGLALEESWRAARRELKRALAVDLILLVAWSAAFVYILVGKRCPIGAFDGWCNAYNTATAASSFVVLAFGFGVFFDIKDLHQSGASPRTRT